MTVFDWAVLVVVLVSILVGVVRGVVSELLALLAWAAAFFLASTFSESGAPFLSAYIADPTLAQGVAFVLLFIAVLMVFSLVRFLAKRLFQAAGLGALDRILGAVFGLARAALVLICMVILGGLTALPKKEWWRDAVTAPPLETAVMALKPYLPEIAARNIHYR